MPVKKIILLVVVLVVVIVGTPGVIGGVAESALEENLNWSAKAASDEGLTVVTESYESGWFTSTSRHRVQVDRESIEAVFTELGIPIADTVDLDALPTLLIDTRVDHGLVPVGSLMGGDGRLSPGLGIATSTLTLVNQGETLALPGTVESHIGFGGTINSSYTVEKGEHEFDGGSIGRWEKSIVEFGTNPSTGKVSINARGGGAEFEDNAFMNASVGPWSLVTNQAPTPYGPVADGDIRFDLESVATADPMSGQTFNMGPIMLESENRLNGDVFDSEARFEMSMNDLPHVGSMQLVLDMAAYGMDGEATGNISQGMQALNNRMEAVTPQELLGVFTGELEGLFRRGFSVEFREIDVRFENGGLDGRLNLSAPPFEDGDFHWTSGVQSMQGDAFFSVPGPLMELALQASNEMNLLIAMGVLKRNAEGDYELNAAYEQGVVTMNGQPMALPLPAPTR